MERSNSQVRDVKPKTVSKFSVIVSCRFSKISHLRLFVSGELFFKAATKLTVPLEWVYFFLNCPLPQPKNKTF